MRQLRIAYMGTPDFAVLPLRILHNAGHSLAAVYCQPPRPSGRGHIVQKSPVQNEAEHRGLEVRTPKTLRDPEEQAFIKNLKLDAIVAAGYGLLVPQAVLEAPRLGSLVIHPSLLPRWRGTAPIQYALLAGDTEIGVTIMQMDAGFDTGPILLMKKVPLGPTATSPDLYRDLFTLGGHMTLEALCGLDEGKLHPQPQSEEGVTYTAKLTREDGSIDWHKPAETIERQVRALTPWPGTFFEWNGEQIKILEVQIVPDQNSNPGTLLDEYFTVACGKHAVRLTKVQRAGKKAIDGASLLRGLRLPLGYSFP